MEAMRRLIAILMVLGLLSATGGCNHTAGVCDCEVGPHNGVHINPEAPPWPPGPPPPAETIKTMPKSNL